MLRLGGSLAAALLVCTAGAAPIGGQEPAPQRGGSPLNPDISAVGELLADLSPEEPAFTEGERLEVREVEIGLQAVVDAYLRADFFIGLHEGAAEIEEAYLTALSLPWGLQARAGHFLVPFGKVNRTHRPELRTVDYPLVLRAYLDPEGLAETGIWLSRLFAPFGFFQELDLLVLSGLGGDARAHGHGEDEEADGEEPLRPDRDLSEEIAVLAHLRNYWDLSAAANIELGFSAGRGTRERLEPLCGAPGRPPCDPLGPVDAVVLERRTLLGADLTVRWRPPARALYRSFVWNTELVHDRTPAGARWGGFTQAQWQLTRRFHLGARFDAAELEVGEHGLETEEPAYEAGVYLTFFPSEFSRFRLAVRRPFGPAVEGAGWGVAIQSTFAVGPHRPHVF